MPTSLITGGAGFIGSHLAEALLDRGDTVIVLDDMSTGSRENLSAVASHPRLELVEGSVSDDARLPQLIDRCDAVFHLAAAVGVSFVTKFPIETVRRNIAPTERILELASRRGVKVFLASSSEVYGKGSAERMREDDDMVLGSPSKTRYIYAYTKLIDEFLGLAYHRERGLPVVVGRFFNVVGPRQSGRYGMVIPRFVSQALAGGPLQVHDDGNQVRCFMHVRDTVRAVVELMQSAAAIGHIFNVGSDEAITIRQVAETVIRIVNPAATIEHISYAQAFGPGFEDVRCRIPDLTRLRATIQFTPQFSMGDILREVTEAERSRMSAQRTDAPTPHRPKG
jgi:UDP-glucose 4-epimerase